MYHQRSALVQPQFNQSTTSGTWISDYGRPAPWDESRARENQEYHRREAEAAIASERERKYNLVHDINPDTRCFQPAWNSSTWYEQGKLHQPIPGWSEEQFRKPASREAFSETFNGSRRLGSVPPRISPVGEEAPRPKEQGRAAPVGYVSLSEREARFQETKRREKQARREAEREAQAADAFALAVARRPIHTLHPDASSLKDFIERQTRELKPLAPKGPAFSTTCPYSDRYQTRPTLPVAPGSYEGDGRFSIGTGPAMTMAMRTQLKMGSELVPGPGAYFVTSSSLATLRPGHSSVERERAQR